MNLEDLISEDIKDLSEEEIRARLEQLGVDPDKFLEKLKGE